MQEKPAYLRYTIQPGDTLSGIARRYGVTVGILQEVNAITNPDLIYAGQRLCIPVSTPQILTNYTVQAGDTLWDLARKFGTSVEAITRLNDLDDPSKISVGQRLRIPF